MDTRPETYCGDKLDETGVPIATIIELLGHITLAMTIWYCHPANPIVEAVEILGISDIEVTLVGKNEAVS